MANPGEVRIRYEEIPEAVMRPLYHDILKAVQKFKQDPENQRKFKVWLAEREAQKKAVIKDEGAH